MYFTHLHNHKTWSPQSPTITSSILFCSIHAVFSFISIGPASYNSLPYMVHIILSIIINILLIRPFTYSLHDSVNLSLTFTSSNQTSPPISYSSPNLQFVMFLRILYYKNILLISSFRHNPIPAFIIRPNNFNSSRFLEFTPTLLALLVNALPFFLLYLYKYNTIPNTNTIYYNTLNE
jgi:hypothetical protein